jgi:hypothetical protein
MAVAPEPSDFIVQILLTPPALSTPLIGALLGASVPSRARFELNTKVVACVPIVGLLGPLPPHPPRINSGEAINTKLRESVGPSRENPKNSSDLITGTQYTERYVIRDS